MTKVDSIERLINSAWQALSLGNASLAMQHAQQANAIDSSSAEVAHILGVLASRDGRPDIALPLLQKSIDAGVTAQKLRHITEALLVAGHAKAALSPITDALKNYPAEAETFGLLAAVQVALEQWSYALKSAKEAVNLSPHNPAWQGTLSFCLLMQQQWVEGFEAWSGRAEKFSLESRSPAFHLAKPCELWIKNEQGPGDTLFFARYAPYLNQLGYKLHLQTDKKTLPLLAQTQVFASVQDKFKAKPTDFWLSIGDLPLAAIQTACIPVQNALKIHADEKLKAKYRQELAKVGPAPYIAVTWRGGPKGKKQRAGVRMFEKFVDPKVLGELIKPIQATFISVQRVPDTAEYLALCKASGKKIADFSALNNNLSGMLALLDIIDDYIAVPNTNVHLRESLEKSTHVLLNRPYQDWRWLADGDKSPWYPNATIYRPSIEGEWQAAFNMLQTNLIKHHTQHDNSDKPLLAQNSNAEETLQQSEQAILENVFKEKIAEGWQAIDHNDVATAIKMAQEVMTHSPQHPRAMHLLGWAALTDLKFEIAVSILQNAAQLAPNDGIIWRDFLRSLIAIKKFDDVFKIAEQLLQNPDLRSKSSIYYARAALHLQLGNNENALADYDACLAISPNYIDASGFSGMIRMKTGDVRRGFREYTARKEARYDGHVCPWLRGNVKGVKVLIRRHMGLGDELSYLRYLPWLENAGVEVDYWAGAKLAPILTRMGYCKQVISDKESLPESENYDLCFEVNELPLAVEALGAPEIAPPLPIKPREDLIAKWKIWLEAQGPAPYIGFNWRAGAASQDTSIVFSKLAKAIDATPFANALGVVNATFISLQRNVTKLELDQFSRDLGAPIHDAAGLTDDLDDLLALLSLLDENIGVSNTNMHLRAGLGLGSKVLVQSPAGDWRWGSEGTHSIWFTQSKVYRQTLQDGSWNEALSMLSQDLSHLYTKKASDTVISPIQRNTLHQQSTLTQKIIWVTAGEISETPMGKTSNIGSTRNRVLAPAKGLESLGWQSEFVNEGLSEVMGGWGNVLPQNGDTVIISKVFTTHGARLAKDAKDRGARVIVDFCDNFLDNPKRAPLQRALAELADKVVFSTTLIADAFNFIDNKNISVIPDLEISHINLKVVEMWSFLLGNQYSTPEILSSTNTRLKLKTKNDLIGTLPTRLSVMAASDKFYLREHGASFVASAILAGHDVHLHVVNPIDKDLDLLHHLSNAALKLSQHRNKLTFTYENIDLSKISTDEKYSYYACSRFLIAPVILQETKQPIIISDIDAIFNKHIDVFEGYELALYTRKPIKGKIGNEEVGTKVAAGLVFISPKAINFAKDVANKIISADELIWFIDQIALDECFEKYKDELNFYKIDSIILDWKFNQNTYIWTAKGDRKYNDQTYIDKKEAYKKILESNQHIDKKLIDEQKNNSIVKPKRLVWLTTGKLNTSLGYVSSEFASTRYRVLLPAANLGPFGWQSQIINEQDLVEHGWKNTISSGDIIVVSKILNPNVYSRLIEAKEKSCIIVADFCDNHFERADQIGELQHKILTLVNKVVSSTPELSQFIQNIGQHDVSYISDCFEGVKGKPSFTPSKPLKLMWFGNYTNHDTLPEFLKQLALFAKQTPVEIDLVTLHDNGDEAAKNACTSTLKVNYVPWSLGQFNAKLYACDMVVIPTLQADYKSGKSPNRIIEPIWAGKYVVAGHLPAYEPFALFATIGNDLIAGIKWAINHPSEVIEKIKAGQAYIAANHTPKLIGEKWHEVLCSVTKAEPSQTIKTNQNAQFFDSAEVKRFFTLDGIEFDDVNDAFDKRYPVNADFKPAKKIAVFTAIFGGYDAPPEIVSPDPNLDYILFADADIKDIPVPWQLRRLPRTFADPQVDARRVKVLSHQFLPDYQASVWIDGNVSPKQLSAEYVNATLQHNPMAVCRHQFRHCIYEEATQIVKTAKDAPAPVMRQMQFYQSIGFPQNQGLHATMFLMRDHRDSRVLKHNARWWELLIEYSKRDQLSFDFVRWEMQTPVLTLPFNCRENTLFQWGIDASRGHVGKVRRNDESLGRAYFQNEQVKINIEIAEPYKAVFDRWTKRFLLELFDLNSHLLASKQTLGTSMLSKEAILNTPFSLPDPRNGVVYQLFQTAIAESQQTLCFGDASGHAVLLALNSSSTAIAQTIPDKQPHLNILTQWFGKVHPKRYQFIAMPRASYEKIKLNDFDTILLGGDFELSIEEIHTLILKANINTKFVVLGNNSANFALCLEQQNYHGFMQVFRDIKHHGIACYIKQATIEENDDSVDQQTYRKSVYGVWLKKRENDMTWHFAMRGNYGFYFARWIAALDKCVFLDIGANYGLYSILASQNNNIEAVHAFEPHPETFTYLTSNLNVNQSKKCNPHPFAIATIAGKQTIYADASHSGKATLRDNINPQDFSESFEITSISNNELDELITLKPKQNVVVKIDVEGYEIEVIKTLIQSKLWQQVSHIYCEVDTSYLDENKLLNLMKAQGFKVLHQNGTGDHYDLMFAR